MRVAAVQLHWGFAATRARWQMLKLRRQLRTACLYSTLACRSVASLGQLAPPQAMQVPNQPIVAALAAGDGRVVERRASTYTFLCACRACVLRVRSCSLCVCAGVLPIEVLCDLATSLLVGQHKAQSWQHTISRSWLVSRAHTQAFDTTCRYHTAFLSYAWALFAVL